MTTRSRIYEQQAMRDVAGDMIRPGGLALTDHALAYCGLPAGAQVLDVGCGPGASVEHLIAQHHLSALGVDPSALLLRDGRRRTDSLPLVQSLGEHLPFATNSFDAILTECSLSVIKDPDMALTEFRRVLRNNGYLVLSDIYARNPHGVAALRNLNIDSCLSGAMLQDEVTNMVRRHGFVVTLWEDHTEALKVFTARLIWSQESIQQLWRRTLPSCAEASDVQTAIAHSRPGYYVLIAQTAGV